MTKADLSKFVQDARASIAKHSPEILTTIGIIGMTTTTVLAVRATPKALKNIEEVKKAEKKDKLTPAEVIKATWKCYIPAVVTGVTSTMCLIGANSVHVRRNAAIATAYKISETAFTEYKNKVVETIGEKKDSEIRDKIAKDKAETYEHGDTEVILTNTGDCLCMDAAFNRFFTSSYDKIRRVENDLNRQLNSNMTLSMNEFYVALGLSSTDSGDDLGWNIDYPLDLHLSATLTPDGRPCIVVSHRIPPRYEYDKHF